MSSKGTYDYIVIGGGSAGSVVASRLSEDPDVSVLLLEAGGLDSSIYIAMPIAFRELQNNRLTDWKYQSAPEPFAEGRVLPVPRGRVLGGTSSINGMMYSRGHPRDYDGWAQLGAPGWSFDDVLPYFMKSERHWRGESERHGGSGPLAVSANNRSDPLTAAIHEAAGRRGYRVLDDFEADEPDGFARPEFTIGAGRRASASRAFLWPARRRANLTIQTGAHATRIIVERDRAVGVEFLLKGRLCLARAEREVVLSGGAFASPHILMLSGIGPADHLRRHGITVHKDLPGVGRNLQDHTMMLMMFKDKRASAFGQALRADRVARAALAWRLALKGFASTVPVASAAYYRSNPDLDRPDLESVFVSANLGAQLWFPGWRPPAQNLLTVMNMLLHPPSQGFVELNSSDPLAPPKIQYNLLADPDSIERLKLSIAWVRDLMREAPLRDFVGDEVFPGPGVIDDETLEAHIRRSAGAGHHPAGTCAMGTVVDAQLKVKDVQGLRVADASVMPELIGGHTNAVAIMIGERAADFVRRKAG